MPPDSYRILALMLTLSLLGRATARAEPPDPKDYAISLELKHEVDPPGPPVMRELAQQRYEIAAAEMTARWENFLAFRGTHLFVVQSSARLLDAQAATSRRPEVQLDALEGHLQRMLLAFDYMKVRWENGRGPLYECEPPFTWAWADAKLRLATAIFEQRAKSPPGPEEMDRLWIELGCRDTAHACRVRWEIQSAGAAGEAFLCRHLAEPAPKGPPPDRVIFFDQGGEACVQRSNPAAIESERDEENAARHRRWQRARDLLREMLEEDSRAAP